MGDTRHAIPWSAMTMDTDEKRVTDAGRFQAEVQQGG
jgi:hypothetical protein